MELLGREAWPIFEGSIIPGGPSASAPKSTSDSVPSSCTTAEMSSRLEKVLKPRNNLNNVVVE